MKFKVDKYRVEFSENVLSIFSKFKQKDSRSCEAGGIILGQVKEDLIYVSKATIPNLKDSATRFSFVRDREIAQQFVDYEFYNSFGTIIYLGEWHTHSEKCPKPSNTDIKMIEKQFKENKLNEDFILMCIIGVEETFLSLYNGKHFYKSENVKSIPIR